MANGLNPLVSNGGILPPQFVAQLPYHFGETVHECVEAAEPADGDGWLTVRLPFESLGEARTKLLGLGGVVEVLAPLPLRLSLADFAAQIVKLYEET